LNDSAKSSLSDEQAHALKRTCLDIALELEAKRKLVPLFESQVENKDQIIKAESARADREHERAESAIREADELRRARAADQATLKSMQGSLETALSRVDLLSLDNQKLRRSRWKYAIGGFAAGSAITFKLTF